MSGTTTEAETTTEATATTEAEAPAVEQPATILGSAVEPEAPATPKTEDAKPVVPEAYEFKAPEGVTLDTEAIAQFSVLAKEAGLTQEAAQKLVDFQVSRDTQSAAAQQRAYADLTQSWAEATRKDPEIGGKNFDQSVANANKALDTYGTPELKKLMSDLGWGNHPELIRAFSRAGAALQEATVHSGGGQESQATDRVSKLFAKTIADAERNRK